MPRPTDPGRVDETPLWCFRPLPLGDAAVGVLRGNQEETLGLGAGAVREALIPLLPLRVALAGTTVGTPPEADPAEEMTLSHRDRDEDTDDMIRTMQGFLQQEYFLPVSLPRSLCLLQLLWLGPQAVVL